MPKNKLQRACLEREVSLKMILKCSISCSKVAAQMADKGFLHKNKESLSFKPHISKKTPLKIFKLSKKRSLDNSSEKKFVVNFRRL